MRSLGVTDARIKKWLCSHPMSRAEQVCLLKIVTGSGFFYRGTRLRCPQCSTPLTAKHVLIECAALMDDRLDVFDFNDVATGNPCLEQYAGNEALLPCFVQATLPTLRAILAEATSRAQLQPQAKQAPHPPRR